MGKQEDIFKENQIIASIIKRPFIIETDKRIYPDEVIKYYSIPGDTYPYTLQMTPKGGWIILPGQKTRTNFTQLISQYNLKDVFKGNYEKDILMEENKEIARILKIQEPLVDYLRITYEKHTQTGVAKSIDFTTVNPNNPNDLIEHTNYQVVIDKNGTQIANDKFRKIATSNYKYKPTYNINQQSPMSQALSTETTKPIVMASNSSNQSIIPEKSNQSSSIQNNNQDKKSFPIGLVIGGISVIVLIIIIYISLKNRNKR